MSNDSLNVHFVVSSRVSNVLKAFKIEAMQRMKFRNDFLPSEVT